VVPEQQPEYSAGPRASPLPATSRHGSHTVVMAERSGGRQRLAPSGHARDTVAALDRKAARHAVLAIFSVI
jgi:hypothetical protein